MVELLEKLVVETEEAGKQFLSHIAQVSVKDPQTLLVNVFDLNVPLLFPTLHRSTILFTHERIQKKKKKDGEISRGERSNLWTQPKSSSLWQFDHGEAAQVVIVIC